MGKPAPKFLKGDSMENEVAKKVLEHCTPIVEELGYELVDAEYEQKENGMNLTVFIYKKEGITLDDCQIVARALDQPLDDLNPTKDEHYYFNVSSLGLDRPLKTQKDFVRGIGTEVELTFQDGSNEKHIQGVIKQLENDKITINQKGKMVTINFEAIIKALPVIKF